MAEDALNAIANRDLGDAPSRVVPLSEHDELEIADGYPDVRGWDVRDFNGRSVGYVYDLLVDHIRVWYLDVLLDPEFAGNEADPRVLIPIERAGLDGRSETVLLRGIDATDVRALVPYGGGSRGQSPEREEPRVARSEQRSVIEHSDTTAAAAQEMPSERAPGRHVRFSPVDDSANWAKRSAAHTARRREERMSRMANDRLDVFLRRRGGNGSSRQDERARESVGGLLKELSGDATHLIQQEIALAKIELREAGTTLASDAAKIGIGVGLALPGVFALTAFLVVGLGDLLDNYWLAALIVGVLFVAVGALLAGNAVADIRRRGLAPEATVETVREDGAWAKREMRELKQHVMS